ncbi:MAG: ROK family protein [Acidimicrobiia bacterium]|nr:ROK family protein [Acidimicrobiia bacterium]
MELVAALDIGGTKLAAGVVDGQGNVHGRRECPTRATGSSEDLLADACDLLATALAEFPPVVGLGVACAGPITESGVSPLNIPAWRDFPLAGHLIERFSGSIRGPVLVDNDAKAMALGEGWVGAARGESDYVGMVVSTGVGGGIVLDGRPLDGRLGNAGHLGHMLAVPGGARCECGAHGCLEAEASGTAISRDAVEICRSGSADPVLRHLWQEARGREEAGGPLSAVEGLTARDVVRAAQEGDASAARILERAGRLIGRVLADVATLLDLRTVVVGGGVSLAGDLILAPMRDEAGRRATLPYAAGLEIRPAALSTVAGIVGAAADWLWRERGEMPRSVA